MKPMKNLAVAAATTALIGVGAAAQQPPKTATPGAAVAAPKMATAHVRSPLSVASQNQLVGQYCASCHSERGKAGGLVLAGFDAATIDQHVDVAEKMIRKLRTGMMPPPNARRPEAVEIARFIDALETRMDAAAVLNPKPGWRP